MKYLKRAFLFTFFLGLANISATVNADYEEFTSKIDQIYLFDNGSDLWGIRIKLVNPGSLCSEWYIKMNAALRDQMYALALSAKAQGREITLKRRNDSENLENNGTICSVHRIYTD